MFDDSPTSHGKLDPVEETAAAEGDKPETGDVRKFLDNEHAKNETKPEPGKPEQPKKEVIKEVPTWTIRVYDGGELREEKVVLPEEKAPEGTSETTSGKTSGKKSWGGWFKTSFSGSNGLRIIDKAEQAADLMAGLRAGRPMRDARDALTFRILEVHGCICSKAHGV
jgi:hypothetical protein